MKTGTKIAGLAILTTVLAANSINANPISPAKMQDYLKGGKDVSAPQDTSKKAAITPKTIDINEKIGYFTIDGVSYGVGEKTLNAVTKNGEWKAMGSYQVNENIFLAIFKFGVVAVKTGSKEDTYDFVAFEQETRKDDFGVSASAAKGLAVIRINGADVLLLNPVKTNGVEKLLHPIPPS